MQKIKNILHHNSAANTTTGTTNNTMSSMMHPFASQYNLPPNIANWQQGQPIPQGWRLGRQGYLKPAFVLPTHLSNWQQGQPLPQGYRQNKRGTLRPVNYFSWWNSTFNNNSTGTRSSSMMHPFASQYNLPTNIANWQQGQPIPQGWRLGRKGYLKPAFVLPTQYSTWQQGQPLPEGFRLNKRGTLRPVNYFSWWSSSFATSSPTRVSMDAPVVELREKPAVVQEVIKGSVREEIQPVIHREREQLEIREEIQPIYEKSIRPTLVEERALAAEVRPEVRLGSMPVIAEGPKSSVFVEAEQREAVMHAPIVEEVVHKKIIEEVQPVIHREVIAPKVINERKDIYEKIVEAPVVTYSTRPALMQETVATPAPAVEVTTVTTVTQETEFVPSNSSLERGMANLTTGDRTTSADGKKHHFNFLHRNKQQPNTINKH